MRLRFNFSDSPFSCLLHVWDYKEITWAGGRGGNKNIFVFIGVLNSSVAWILASTRIWLSFFVLIFSSPPLHYFFHVTGLFFIFSRFSSTLLLPLYIHCVCDNRQLDYIASFIAISIDCLYKTTSPWLCSTNPYKSCKLWWASKSKDNLVTLGADAENRSQKFIPPNKNIMHLFQARDRGRPSHIQRVLKDSALKRSLKYGKRQLLQLLWNRVQ